MTTVEQNAYIPMHPAELLAEIRAAEARIEHWHALATKGEDMDAVHELADRFSFHPATEITGPTHDLIRAEFRELALRLFDLLPPGRHKELTLTNLQQAMMWANASVAIDSSPGRNFPPRNPHGGRTDFFTRNELDHLAPPAGT